ncbi:MAG: glycine C-acetyltransferase [Planctomycetes bacterium]|nr:glycine C-acetyltransferase [Planctomycetota bacterium]
MRTSLDDRLQSEIEGFKRDGVYKRLLELQGPQGARVKMAGRGEVIVLSSNNYLGLCAVPEVVEAGRSALVRLGAGTGSVRFICGTFDVHNELERELASFLRFERALSYVSCWNANTGLMATVLDEPDALISDEMNHASIIDGVRLCKAPRHRYRHSDMADLERILKETASARHRFVITDGIFSMEGDIARLPDLVALCERHRATLAVDDSHATGVLGRTGRGTPEHFGLEGKVDILTGTLGKALGGAAGGFTCGTDPLVEYLVQRSRPQLFSNALPPTVAASALASVRYLAKHPERVQALHENTRYFREQLLAIGLKPVPGDTPIVPVILGETSKAIRMSELLLKEGVFVTGFGFPVVPQGQARIRCQVSAAHTKQDLDEALSTIKKVAAKLALI